MAALIGSNLFSQPLQYLTIKTNLLDPLNIGLDIPISKRYSLDFGYSKWESYYFQDIIAINTRINLRILIKETKEKSIKNFSNSKQLKQYFFYTGLRYRNIDCRDFDQVDGASSRKWDSEGKFNGLYISNGIGKKNRTVQYWLGFDFLCYSTENKIVKINYPSGIKEITIWPLYSISTGFALNIWNINRPRNKK